MRHAALADDELALFLDGLRRQLDDLKTALDKLSQVANAYRQTADNERGRAESIKMAWQQEQRRSAALELTVNGLREDLAAAQGREQDYARQLRQGEARRY